MAPHKEGESPGGIDSRVNRGIILNSVHILVAFIPNYRSCIQVKIQSRRSDYSRVTAKVGSSVDQSYTPSGGKVLIYYNTAYHVD